MGRKQWKERLSGYQKELECRKLAKSTISIYLRVAERFEEFTEKRCINQETIGAYVDKLKRTYRVGTVNLYVIALNVYLKYLGKEELRIKQEHVTQRHSLENVMGVEEYRRLLNYEAANTSSKYYLLIRTLAQTGIRVGELQFITAERLGNGYICIYNKGRAREIYLPSPLLEELRQYCKEQQIVSGAVFRGNTGKPISRVAVWQTLQKDAEKLQISKDKAHPHSLRHMFAKCYMDKYGNLSELADILGHSNVEITRRYTMSSVEEKRKRMEKLGL
ncbi:MAG: tyrosine-type recombinase/integrase [Lachnospiraceae bacterium]